MNSKEALLVGIAIVVALDAGIFLNKTLFLNKNYIFRSSNEKDDTKDSAYTFKQMANELNKDLPKPIGSNLRLDSVISGINMFIYKSTITNVTAEESDPNVLSKNLSDTIKTNVCSSPDIGLFYVNDLIVQYQYYGKNGKHIWTLTIPTIECEL